MSDDADNQRALVLEARRLAEHLDGTADQLLALAYAGYRAWTKNRRLHFLEDRRHALMINILRYCAETHLLECPPFDRTSNEVIEDALDASYPRYARNRRVSNDGRLSPPFRARRRAK